MRDLREGAHVTYSESPAMVIIPLAVLVLFGALSLVLVCLSYKRRTRKEGKR